MRRARRSIRSVFAIAGFLAAAAAGSRAGGDGEAGRGFALRAGRIYPVDPELPWTIDKGVIVVRDGRIAAIGADVVPPPDLPLLELPDATIAPGLVAAASDLAGQHRGDESIAAGYHAIDSFDRYGNFKRTLLAGVTAAHLAPGAHRLLSGQGAVVKLAGPAASRVLRERGDLTIQLGDAADTPPLDVNFPFPASSDVAIPVPRIQRPSSRLGRVLALDEALDRALAGPRPEPFSIHPGELAAAWNEKLPLRVHADRAADLLAALGWLAKHGRTGYLVGGAEAHRLAGDLRRAGIGLVFLPHGSFRGSGTNFGRDPEPLAAEYRRLAELGDVPLAIGPPANGALDDLRLAAAAAHGAGLDERRALAAVTRAAAEMLGVGDRVGSLGAGKDADFLVLSGHPLEPRTHVLRVYVGGRDAAAAPSSDALVVRAGTVWVNPERQIAGGELLIENGKVTAVGKGVPHPPGARRIDAGPDGFVAPGFIDARGHLELEGDRSSAGADVDWSRIIGPAGAAAARVARAGVTTAIVTPYQHAPAARAAAVKTAGASREARLLRPIAAALVDVAGLDQAAVQSTLRPLLDRAKRYVESWQKYDKDLAEFLEKQKRGEAAPSAAPAGPEPAAEPESGKPDPITGTWEGTVSGGPLPEPQRGKAVLRLEGDQIEGKIIEPEPPVDHRIVATLNGNQIRGHIEADTGGLGFPRIDGQLDGEDRLSGTVSIAGFNIRFEAARIDKKEVEFKVTRRRRGADDGRPQPPRLDPSLEPLRAVFEKKAPILARASTPAQIRELLAIVADEYKLSLALVDAEGADLHAERLARDKIAVVLPVAPVVRRDFEDFHLGDALARRGVPIAFQSDAEDGASELPLRVLFAVERGLSPESALAAVTIEAARLYRLDDRIGSLEVGRDADFVICRGHPFTGAGRVERVFINGEEVQP
jgi:imidazolonepropionase-like amidohydrolase